MKHGFATALAMTATVLALSFSAASVANAANANKHQHYPRVQTTPPHFDASEFFATQYLRGGS